MTGSSEQMSSDAKAERFGQMYKFITETDLSDWHTTDEPTRKSLPDRDAVSEADLRVSGLASLIEEALSQQELSDDKLKGRLIAMGAIACEQPGYEVDEHGMLRAQNELASAQTEILYARRVASELAEHVPQSALEELSEPVRQFMIYAHPEWRP